MKRVYAVGTRTSGTGGFGWFWKNEEADKFFADEKAIEARFKAKGDYYRVFRFVHDTELNTPEEISAEIDAMLFEYEEAAGVPGPENEETGKPSQ
jgi:hypothetical protein